MVSLQKRHQFRTSAGLCVVASWTAVDSRTWRTAYKVNGAVTTIDQLALSPDDKTLTIERTASPAAGRATGRATERTGR